MKLLRPEESVGFIVPTFPTRTPCYSLKPVAPGTALVEGQTSYVMRLAEQHCVSVATIVVEMLAQRQCVDGEVTMLIGTTPNRHGNGFAACDYAINGVVSRAELWVRALEGVTGLNDLDGLTLLSFRYTLNHNLFKEHRSWCPLCLEDWRAIGKPIYEPLIWGLHEMAICIRHNVPLRSRCPVCGRRLRPLAAKGRVGHCSSCDSWLGSSIADGNGEAQQLCIADEDCWHSQQCVELLAGFRPVAPEVMQKWFARQVKVYIDRVYGGYPARLARHLNMQCGVVQSWPSGKVAIRIRSLLRLCSRLGVPASSFFSSPEPTEENVELARRALSRWAEGPLKPRRTVDEIRINLQEALTRPSPPSLHDVARELGYTSSVRLVAADEQLCKMIRKRYVKSGRSHWWLKGPSKGKCAPGRIKATLEEALASADQVSVANVATQLGYASSSRIYALFPELCLALTEKCVLSENVHREDIKFKLVSALGAWPPRPLGVIARECGHPGAGPLWYRHPELCQAVDDRYRSFAENKRATFAQIKLAVREDPPPSWREICSRLKSTPETLKKRYPALQKEIVRNHQHFISLRAKYRYQAAQTAVAEIVSECIRRGTEPTYKIVISRLPKEASHGFFISRLIRNSLANTVGRESARRKDTVDEAAGSIPGYVG